MHIQNFMIRFYPSTDVVKYPWVYHDRYEDYIPGGHTRTGPMDLGRFTALKEDIAANGIENPFIIEYYCKDLPNAKGLRDAPVLAIRTGNNRAEVMHQLKMTHAPALFVVPREQAGKLPGGQFVDIPIDGQLEHRLSKLWKEVVRGNDEPLGEVGAWRDSELLTDLVRSSKEKHQ